MGRPRQFQYDRALQASTRLFIEKGFEGTSLNDLIQAMGIVKPSFYNAFGSKQGLLVQCLEKYSKEALAAFSKAINNGGTLQEDLSDLLSFIESNHRAQQQHPGCLIVECADQCQTPEVQELIREHNQQVQNIIAERIQKGVDDEGLATKLSAQELGHITGLFFQGLAVSYKQSRDTKSMSNAVEAFKNLICENLSL